jgi:hypothetical protein
MSSVALLPVVERVIRFWQQDGIPLLAPMDPVAVRNELSKTGQRYSDDVVDIYSIAGGMANDEMDSHCFSMWPFDKVLSKNKERSYLAFADFLIDSHWYGFVYESKARSKVCVDYFKHGTELEIIADSVEEFFRKYLVDPRSLCLLS